MGICAGNDLKAEKLGNIEAHVTINGLDKDEAVLEETKKETIKETVKEEDTKVEEKNKTPRNFTQQMSKFLGEYVKIKSSKSEINVKDSCLIN